MEVRKENYTIKTDGLERKIKEQKNFYYQKVTNE